MQYGLIGARLGHSYSASIHAQLGDYEYRLCECTEAEFTDLMLRRDFKGLNVTIPYKQLAYRLCDSLSDAARAAGCVNTVVVRPDGALYGHNTDIGFLPGDGHARAPRQRDEAADIAVVSVQGAVRTDDHRVDAARRPGRVGEAVAQAVRQLLVGNGDVQPLEIPAQHQLGELRLGALVQPVFVIAQPGVYGHGIAVAQLCADQTVLHGCSFSLHAAL